VHGCTQVIGDKLSLSDVRLTRCAFTAPELGEGALAAAVAATLGGIVALRGRRVSKLRTTRDRVEAREPGASTKAPFGQRRTLGRGSALIRG
jgi:hypothetical protein